MENNLYVIGIKGTLQDLAKKVWITESLSGKKYPVYSNFWDDVYIIEYNRKEKYYNILKNNFIFDCEKNLFNYMDNNEIDFIGDENPLGNIFQSYSMCILEIVRWAADVAWNAYNWYELINDGY